MYKGKQIGVVIPAYNEAEFVGDVIDTLPAYVDRVYAVDDGSNDGTWDVIRRRAVIDVTSEAPRKNASASQSTRRIVPIRHNTNRGVGGAIKTGYRCALEDEVDIIAVVGGDGQMDPEWLDRILDPVVEGRADYAKGDRLSRATYRAAMPAFRQFGNVLLTVLTRIASGYWQISDPQNGYTAISRRALTEIDLEEMYECYGYCNDLLVSLNVEGCRVVDVPSPSIYGDEESHIDYSTYIPKVSGMLLKNFLWRLKEKYVVQTLHPISLLYAIGIVTTVLGFGRFVRRLVDRDESGSVSRSLSLLIGGAALQALAMRQDMIENESLQAKDEEVTAPSGNDVEHTPIAENEIRRSQGKETHDH